MPCSLSYYNLHYAERVQADVPALGPPRYNLHYAERDQADVSALGPPCCCCQIDGIVLHVVLFEFLSFALR